MTQAINMPTVHQLFSSASRGTTTSDVFDLMDNTGVVFQLDVTAKSGTTPTLDLIVYDGPTESGPWSTLYTFAQVVDTATTNTAAQPTRAPQRFIKATGTVGGSSTPKYTYTLYAVAMKAPSLQINVGSQGGTASFTSLVVTTTSATGAVIGPNGATNPTLQVDGSTSSAATGLKIKSAAAASGLALSVISSGTNEALTIDAKGSGTITLAGTSTGNVVVPRAFVQGTDATDRVTVKGIYMTPSNVAVAVPSITDPDIARVQVDVSSALSMQPAVGDAVIAIPQEALPTNARLQGAWVYQTDGVEITFGSEGGNVTGANKNFKFLVIDLT